MSIETEVDLECFRVYVHPVAEFVVRAANDEDAIDKVKEYVDQNDKLDIVFNTDERHLPGILEIVESLPTDEASRYNSAAADNPVKLIKDYREFSIPESSKQQAVEPTLFDTDPYTQACDSDFPLSA